MTLLYFLGLTLRLVQCFERNPVFSIDRIGCQMHERIERIRFPVQQKLDEEKTK
jgi:hypothetical protein